MYLKLDCVTEKQAQKLQDKFCLNSEHTLDELDDYGVKYTAFSTREELRDAILTSKSLVFIISNSVQAKQADHLKPTSEIAKTSNKKIPDGVIFHTGMSLNDFLKQNNQIRSLSELRKYFSREAVEKGLNANVFMLKKDKIYY